LRVTPYFKVKFPTADKDRGLGTGEFDETLGVDVSKRLIDALFGFLTLSYTFIGDPPGADFRNSFGWSVGAAYAKPASACRRLRAGESLHDAEALAPPPGGVNLSIDPARRIEDQFGERSRSVRRPRRAVHGSGSPLIAT